MNHDVLNIAMQVLNIMSITVVKLAFTILVSSQNECLVTSEPSGLQCSFTPTSKTNRPDNELWHFGSMTGLLADLCADWVYVSQIWPGSMAAVLSSAGPCGSEGMWWLGRWTEPCIHAREAGTLALSELVRHVWYCLFCLSVLDINLSIKRLCLSA